MWKTARMLGALTLMVCLSGTIALAADEPLTPGLPAGADVAGRKKIVFISGKPSHGFAQHEQFAGCMLLAKDLNESMPGIVCEVYKHEWPKDPHALDGAAAIIIFCDGGPGHLVIPHLDQVAPLMAKGVGLGCIHYGVEVPQGPAGEALRNWIGGYFKTFWSVNPNWTAHYTQIPEHEVTRGVHPFSTEDEWYYHMLFREGMKGVTPILSAVPPDRTREGKDDAHGGNPEVRSGIGKHQPEVTVWVVDREDGGRGFGCTGAHYHFNWAQNDFRKTILNCIVWSAHIEVPKDGVQSKTPTPEELMENLDPKKVPADFSMDKLKEKIEKMNQPDDSVK